MKGLFISLNGIKNGVNLTENYTSNILYQSIEENTNKFVNQEVSMLISEFDKKKKEVIDYLDFNLFFCGSVEEIQTNITFEEFIKYNSDRIIAIFKRVNSFDTKSFIVDFVQTETDYKYDYIYLKLSKIFEVFNSYGIEYKVDTTPRVQQQGIYNDETSTRIIVSYTPQKKYHIGVVSAPTFMSQFISKLKSGELKIETCPQVEIGSELTQEYIVKQLESYQKLLESGIIDEATKEEQGPVKKLTLNNKK